MKNTKFTKGLCVVLAIALAIGGSLAYFTDYATTQSTGTAGTVALSMDSNINLLNDEGMDIINPGDMRDGSFTVTNEGNKSIDVRTTIALTAFDHEGNAIAFTGDAATQSEYDLYLASDVELVEGYGYMPKDGAQPLQVKSVDGNVITYVLPEYALNGNSDKYAEVETVDGVTEFSHANDFVFVMKGAAGNAWQDSSVQLDVIVEAKQHENTNAGWDIVAQESMTHGSIAKDVVKGETIITEIDGAANPDAPEQEPTYITVISKNENGEDLNATSKLIEGKEREDLLYSLEQSGLANAEDVDLLIDVESDDFDGMADTTFDVSDLAEDGDKVIILHYDETKGEWEFIAEETVVDGKVSGDFSSYSPVVFVKVEKPVETPEEAPELNPNAEHTIDAGFFVFPLRDMQKVVFTSGPVPEGVSAIDVSEAKDGSIMQYKDASGTTAFITTPDGGKIMAPANSDFLFGNVFVEELHFHNFDFANVTSASDIFFCTASHVYIDSWNNDIVSAAAADSDLNIHSLAECAGHEFAGAITGCEHMNVQGSSLTVTTHALRCNDCWATLGTENCTFDPDYHFCNKCSNQDPDAPMPGVSISAYDEEGHSISAGNIFSVDFPGNVATIEKMNAVYEAQGVNTTAFEVIGFKESWDSEVIVDEVPVYSYSGIVVVVKLKMADVTHYGLSDVLTTYEMAGYYPGMIYYVDDMSVIPEECLANGNELVGSYSGDPNVMFYWTTEHETNAYVYSETGWSIPAYLLGDYGYYNSMIPLDLTGVTILS